jgi:hypothetical protein
MLLASVQRAGSTLDPPTRTEFWSRLQAVEAIRAAARPKACLPRPALCALQLAVESDAAQRSCRLDTNTVGPPRFPVPPRHQHVVMNRETQAAGGGE